MDYWIYWHKVTPAICFSQGAWEMIHYLRVCGVISAELPYQPHPYLMAGTMAQSLKSSYLLNI